MFLHEYMFLVFSFTFKTWSLVIQHCRLLLFIYSFFISFVSSFGFVPFVEFASVTAGRIELALLCVCVYIHIHTHTHTDMHSRSYVPPN